MRGAGGSRGLAPPGRQRPGAEGSEARPEPARPLAPLHHAAVCCLELRDPLQHLTAVLQSPVLLLDRTHTGGAQIENVSWNNLDFHHFPHNGDSFN